MKQNQAFAITLSEWEIFKLRYLRHIQLSNNGLSNNNLFALKNNDNVFLSETTNTRWLHKIELIKKLLFLTFKREIQQEIILMYVYSESK